MEPRDKNGQIKWLEIETCMEEYNVSFEDACEIINQLACSNGIS